MKTYLVTGGAGFIGSHLVKSLLNQGKKVRVLDNFHSGKEENLKGVLDDIELIKGDITDYHTVTKSVKGVNIIFHMAAVPSVPNSIKNPLLSNHVNVTGTLQILHAAVQSKVDRVIYSSSSSAYGDSTIIPKKEDIKASPLSPYAVSKYAAELYCRVFHDLYGLQTLSLRYFNVFGPRQNPNSEYAAVIPKFTHAILMDKSPTIYGDGTQTRDFTYVDNVVSANLLAVEAPKLQGEVVNVGCGNGIQINGLVDQINIILGKRISPIYMESRKGDVKQSVADIEKAEALLTYKPSVSFHEGLRYTIEWYKKRYSQERNTLNY